MTHFVQRRWLYLSFVVIVAGVAGGWFQAAQQTSTELPAPTIRVTTHLVLIDAVVTDKQGNPIAGLRPETSWSKKTAKRRRLLRSLAPCRARPGQRRCRPVSTRIGSSIAQQGQSQ